MPDSTRYLYDTVWTEVGSTGFSDTPRDIGLATTNVLGDDEFTDDCRVQVESVSFEMIGGSICDP